MEVDLLQQLARLRSLRGHVLRGETDAALTVIGQIQNVVESLICSLEED